MNRRPPAGPEEGSVSGFCSTACYCCFRQHERFGGMKRANGRQGGGCSDGGAAAAVADWGELKWSSSGRLTETQHAEEGRIQKVLEKQITGDIW